jgi:hypothetical protein
MEFRALPATHPELMAIGDSIFNGVRSATINESLALTSPPAFVARGLGLPMRQPNYRRPVLFDLEAEMRRGVDLHRLRASIIDNAERWLEERGEWSSQRFFDNIAVAGEDYVGLNTRTAGASRAQLPLLLLRLRQRSELDFDTVGEMFFALNSAFILNPTSEPQLDDLTQLEQVASRRPKRLLVNIGNNEGLFGIGISGSYDRRYLDRLRTIPDLATALATTLRDEAGDIGHIYVNLLIRPRTLGNLAPRRDEDMWNRPGDGYYDRYVGRLGALNGLDAEQMQAFDAAIEEINDETRAAIDQIYAGQATRVVYVDTFAMSNQYDGKHYGNSRMVEVQAGPVQKRLSNLPFSANPLFGFNAGGLFGLDNMHPTNVGYAILANRIGAAIATTEGLAFTPIELQDAFEGDSLLQDPPRHWDVVMLLASLAGLFSIFDL